MNENKEYSIHTTANELYVFLSLIGIFFLFLAHNCWCFCYHFECIIQRLITVWWWWWWRWWCLCRPHDKNYRLFSCWRICSNCPHLCTSVHQV